MPVAEKLVTKKKDKEKNASSSSSVDLRQRIHQRKKKNIQDSEVINIIRSI